MGGTLLDYLTGPILFCSLGGLWLLSKGRAIGFGDAKLALAIGVLLGAPAGISAIVLSFWIGAVFGLLLIGISRFSPLFGGHKRITIRTEIPFAPFLVLGAWFAVILELNLLHVPLF